MTWSRKSVYIAVGLAALAIAGEAFFHFGLRRGDVADASPAPELLSEVPAGAPTLVYIDWAAIRASGFYQQRPDRGPIAIPDHNYADFVQATGFDFEKDLDRAVIASWPPGLSADDGKQDQNRTDPSKSIVVADGRFDRKKIRDYALRKGKVDHQEGHEVFLFPVDGQPDGKTGWNSIVFLNDQRIAIVEGPSIAPLLAHRDKAPTADPGRERAAHVAGAAIFAISRVPSIPPNFSPGGIQSAQLLNLARSVQWVTVAARPEGNDMRVAIEGECLTPTDARQLQAALEVFRLFGRAALESPKTSQSMDPVTLGILETILKTADISATAEKVRILVEFTPDVLKLNPPHKTR